MNCQWMIWGDYGKPIVVYNTDFRWRSDKNTGNTPYTQLTTGPRNELQT